MIQGIEYHQYCNASIGYCIDLASNVFTFHSQTEKEALVECFISKDQQATLIVRKGGYHHTDKEGVPDLRGFFNALKRNYTPPFSDSTFQLTKASLYKRHCEFAGFKNDGLLFREICFLKGKHIIGLQIWYPRRQKLLYDKIVQQFIQSFK